MQIQVKLTFKESVTLSECLIRATEDADNSYAIVNGMPVKADKESIDADIKNLTEIQKKITDVNGPIISAGKGFYETHEFVFTDTDIADLCDSIETTLDLFPRKRKHKDFIKACEALLNKLENVLAETN